MPATAPVSSARQRVHAAVREDIIGAAREQLAAVGAASLSLRAVARELGMAPSAIYRYFRSRDELLTALIVEAYDAMGTVAEAAAKHGGTAAERFRSVCWALRDWALAHPHEYALLYGTPVPGYHAPELTIDPASRVTRLLGGILRDAYRAGEIAESKIPPISEAMTAQTRPLAEADMAGVPPPAVARGLAVWSFLFGQISFEVFGRFDGVVMNGEVLFGYAITTMLDMVAWQRRGGE